MCSSCSHECLSYVIFFSPIRGLLEALPLLGPPLICRIAAGVPQHQHLFYVEGTEHTTLGNTQQPPKCDSSTILVTPCFDCHTHLTRTPRSVRCATASSPSLYHTPCKGACERHEKYRFITTPFVFFIIPHTCLQVRGIATTPSALSRPFHAPPETALVTRAV